MATDLREVKLRFFNMAICDILRAIRGGSLMGAFTLSACAVDAMAYVQGALPTKGNRANFVKWVDDWMTPLNGRCRPEVLYALRCGLVHTYGYSDAMDKCGLLGFRYVHNEPSEHWGQPFSGYYILNLDSHVAEVCLAAFRFFDTMISQTEEDAPFARAVEARVRKLISVQMYEVVALERGRRKAIVRSQPALRRFGEMDPALALLDEEVEPRVGEIAAEIRGIYQSVSPA